MSCGALMLLLLLLLYWSIWLWYGQLMSVRPIHNGTSFFLHLFSHQFHLHNVFESPQICMRFYSKRSYWCEFYRESHICTVRALISWEFYERAVHIVHVHDFIRHKLNASNESETRGARVCIQKLNETAEHHENRSRNWKVKISVVVVVFFFFDVHASMFHKKSIQEPIVHFIF